MQPDQAAFSLGGGEFFWRHFIGPQSLFVFQNMIEIFALQLFQQPAIKKPVAKFVQVVADLEIDQVRAAIIPQQNIFGLVRIDIRDVAAMEFVQQIDELIEKFIRHGAMF